MYRTFIHVLAVLCGLSIGGIVGTIAVFLLMAGQTVKGALLLPVAVYSGYESWHQTLRLNLDREDKPSPRIGWRWRLTLMAGLAVFCGAAWAVNPYLRSMTTSADSHKGRTARAERANDSIAAFAGRAAMGGAIGILVGGLCTLEWPARTRRRTI